MWRAVLVVCLLLGVGSATPSIDEVIADMDRSVALADKIIREMKRVDEDLDLQVEWACNVSSVLCYAMMDLREAVQKLFASDTDVWEVDSTAFEDEMKSLMCEHANSTWYAEDGCNKLVCTDRESV